MFQKLRWLFKQTNVVRYSDDDYHNHYMIALGYVITLYETGIHRANSRLSDTVAS